MNFGHVQLPRDLLEAAEENRLVVFAGAGVSCPPPSNLPTFNKLAHDICGLSIAEGREDRMLGEADRSGADIYSACAKKLYGSHTSHTELHENILKLFKKGQDVRIITTNFDNHFSSAAQKIYKKDRPNVHYAPALPLGDNFSGIVYLHGSAVHNPRSMVLTDRNFGEAYMTRAWATKFLIDLFSKFDVLFVGYSHKDVTTTYLARGLNPSTTQKRWALRPHTETSDDLSNWQHLDIEVLTYPLNSTNTQNKHSKLADFFSEWVAHRTTRILSKAKRVKKIGRGLPPVSDTEIGFVTHCLGDANLAQRLLHSIKHPSWISWLEKNQFLQKLFSESESLNDSEQTIGLWLSSFARKNYPQLIFDLIRRNGERLNDQFAGMLTQNIWVSRSDQREKYFAHWVLLLIACGKLNASSTYTTYILSACSLPRDREIALRLFDMSTTPRLLLKDISYRISDENKDCSPPTKTGFEVGYSADPYWLCEAWEKIFLPNLELIHSPLLQICEKQIHDTYRLQSSLFGYQVRFDSFDWDRSSIARHEQDNHPLFPIYSLLVDALRDIMTFLLKTDYSRAEFLRESWWKSNIRILKRLSIYSVTIDTQVDPDIAIKWILSKNIVFSSGMKKEVFDALSKFYSKCSTEVKKKLLQRIARGYTGSVVKRLEPQTFEYEKYNLLVWLHRNAPDCELLKTSYNEIKLQHPEFGEREHPQFSHWIGSGSFSDPSKDFDLDEIIARPPIDFVESLISSNQNSFKKDQWSHIGALEKLFPKNTEWASEFINIISKKENIREDIWHGVLLALKKVSKQEDYWDWLLGMLEMLPHRKEIYSGIAYMISHSIWDEEKKSTNEQIRRAAELMNVAWRLCSQNTDTLGPISDNWYTSAINHVGGWIGGFWVHYTSHLYNNDKSKWKGIPKDIQKAIVDAIDGKTPTHIYARISVAPFMAFWYTWDAKFTASTLLPMLDWERDSVTAQQTWSVLLNYNRGFSKALENALVPHYRELAENSDKFDDHSLLRFGHFLARTAANEGENPIDSGFINEFLPNIPAIARVGFADWLERFLKNTETDKKIIWDSWLRDYVDMRLMGMPIPLSPEEGHHMIEWCLHLEPIFSEAVDRITKVPCKKTFTYGLIKNLAKAPMIDSHPLHSCKLLNVVLKQEDYPRIHPELTGLHEKWKPQIGKSETFQEFEELMFKRGLSG